MINMDEINAEIAALEAGKTTYATCERLSILKCGWTCCKATSPSAK